MENLFRTIDQSGKSGKENFQSQSYISEEDCTENEKDKEKLKPAQELEYPSVLNDGRTLFIGDVARFCSENEVKIFFKEAGEVEKIDLKKKSGVNIGYGFVRMKKHSDAVLAISRLRGRVLCGRPINIGWGIHNYWDSNYGFKGTKFNSRNSLFVRFTSSEVGKLVTEVVLAEVFSKFGEFVDCAIKSSNVNKFTGLQKGFGFVHFSESPEDIKSILQFLQSHKKIEVDCVNYSCEPSRNFLGMLESLDIHGPQHSYQCESGYSTASSLTESSLPPPSSPCQSEESPRAISPYYTATGSVGLPGTCLLQQPSAQQMFPHVFPAPSPMYYVSYMPVIAYYSPPNTATGNWIAQHEQGLGGHQAGGVHQGKSSFLACHFPHH